MARIVIIGAGMSGLAAASRLATLGHRVTVCEATATYGGQVDRYERDGFAFDTGPALLTLPAVYRDLALKTGREPLEELVGLTPVDPESRHLLPDGTALLLPNASRGGVVRALDDAFGVGAGELWGEVMNRGRAVWEATRRPLLEEPLPADPTPLHNDPYPAPPQRGLARLRRRRPYTLADMARQELGGHPGLATLLHEHALRFGLDPREAPAGAAVLPYMEQSFGVWYVRGGMRTLAEAVYRRCEQRGVEFRFSAPVSELVLTDGRAAGVVAGGERIEADLVLCAADPRGLVPGIDRPRDRVRRLSVLLALRGERPEDTAHRTVVHSAEPERELADVFDRMTLPDRPTVQVLRPDDASLIRDAEREAAVLTVTVPDVEAVPASYADGLLDHLAKSGLDLTDRVLWHELRLSEPFPAPALPGRLSLPNRSPIPGLTLIGEHAHPGGGLARAGMSASITAGVIGPA